MAKSDVLVRMKADVNGYDAGIAKARRTLEGFKQDNLSLGGILNQTSKSLASAAAGFLSVAAAADLIKNVVGQSIELARSGEGVRLAFERLNDPGLLDGLREATHGTVNDIELMKAAVKFKDFRLPLEELGTMLAFAQQKAKDTGQSVDYMVDSIVTGLGRKSLMILDNLGLSAAEIKEKMGDTGDMTKAVGEIIRDQMSKAGDYVETAAERATKAEVDLQNAMTDLGNTLLPLQEQGAELFNTLEVGAIRFLNEGLTPIVPKLMALKDNISKIYDILANNTVVDTVLDNMQTGIDNLVQMIPMLKLVRSLFSDNGETGGGTPPTENPDTIKTIDEIVVNGKKPKTKPKTPKKKEPDIDFNKALRKVNTDDLKKVVDHVSPYAMMLDDIKEKILDIKDADLGGTLAELGNKEVVDEIEAITQRIEQQQKAFDLAAQSAANFGAALSGLEDPGLKAAGTVLSAIANIALSFSQAAVQASSLGPYGWIAYMAAGTAALATTISSIHSLTGYATGGEVKGNSYSGDNVPIMANAGEIVLTRAMAGNLASQIQGAGSNLRVTGVLQGRSLLMVVENELKSQGKGEIATWKS